MNSQPRHIADKGFESAAEGLHMTSDMCVRLAVKFGLKSLDSVVLPARSC